ncbi:MAG: hypothetical protein A3J28_11350, partial [Acidobacteria bacterium RIFCSPLOWO2_12_FULL_60_22]
MANRIQEQNHADISRAPRSRARGILTVLAIAVGIGWPALAQQTAITGVVKNASGEPVSGALVRVRSEGLGLGFLVVSQAQGRFSTPNLLAGKYTVEGFGGNFQSAAPGPVEVRNGQAGNVDVILSVPLQIPPREKRLTDEDYRKILPDSDVRAKRLITTWCAYCHTLQEVVSARMTREEWQQTFDRMRDQLYENRKRPLELGSFTQQQEGEAMVDYLAKHLGPDAPVDPRVAGQSLPRRGGALHPNRNWPGSLLQGAGAKYVMFEYALPSGSTPRDIAVDSQGIAWVSERSTGMLGRFDPRSLSYTRIAPPAGKGSKWQLNAVAVDAEDQVWYVDDGPNARLLRYDPKGGEFQSYPLPEYRYAVAPGASGARMTALRFWDGSIWGTGTTANRIVRLDPKTGKATKYPVPKGSEPYGLAIGGDKMIWYSAQFGNAIVKLDPGTGRLTQYKAPTPHSDLRGMAADGEGNLWAAGTESNKLIKMDYRSGERTEYSVPTEGSGPFALDVDAKRKVIWFSE